MANAAKEPHEQGRADERDASAVFFCECEDDDCLEEIVLTPAVYEHVSRGGECFVVAPHHIGSRRLLVAFSNYWVVRETVDA